MSCSIGEFYIVHYQKMLENYVYHRILMCFLVKHECKELQRQSFFMISILLLNNVIVLAHWRHNLTWKFIQRHFVSTLLSSYKVILVNIMINISMIEAISQMWRWTFTHMFQMNLLIMQLLHVNIFKGLFTGCVRNIFIKDGIIYDTIYGCIKK